MPRIKGYRHSKETIEKLRLAKIGHIPWNKGKTGLHKMTEESKIKMRISHLGKNKGKDNGMYNRRGERNPNWKGGVTNLIKLIRHLYKYRQWRSDIFTRDEWTCQECGIRSGFGKAVYLEAHHIKSFAEILKEYDVHSLEEAEYCEELWDINNGITLCNKCHGRTKKGNQRQIAN